MRLDGYAEIKYGALNVTE